MTQTDFKKNWQIIFKKHYESFLRQMVSVERFNKHIGNLHFFDNYKKLFDFLLKENDEYSIESWCGYLSLCTRFSDGSVKVFHIESLFINQIEHLYNFFFDKNSSNKHIASNFTEIIESMEKEIKELYENREDYYNKIFVEPFDKSFDPFSYLKDYGIIVDDIDSSECFYSENYNFFANHNGSYEDCANWFVFEETVAEFFFRLFTIEDSEVCLKILNKLFDYSFEYQKYLFVPRTNLAVSNVYNIAIQLPELFCLSLFTVFNGTKWANQLLLSLRNKNEQNFYDTFLNCDLETFAEKYYSALLLSLHFYYLFKNDQYVFPVLKNYIYISSPKRYCDYIKADENTYNDPYWFKFLIYDELVDTVEERYAFQFYEEVESHFDRLLFDIKDQDCDSVSILSQDDVLPTKEQKSISYETPNYSIGERNIEDAHIDKPKEENQDDYCIYNISGFDIDKLVDKLTTKQLFEGKEYGPLVVGTSEGDTAEKVKDNLHYFFEPDSSHRSFKLKWNGQHAIGLKLLILLLLNKNYAITEENAIDEKEKDFISPNISKNIGQKFWSTVNQVFNRNSVINSSISPTCPEDTRKKYIHYMHFIAHIVYSCKK